MARIAWERYSTSVLTLLSLNYFAKTTSLTGTDNDDALTLVKFSNSLVPPLFGTYSEGKENVVLSPFGLATSIAIAMECLEGQPFKDIVKLFKIDDKVSRQKLRRGFQVVLGDFTKSSSSNEEIGGSYSKAFLTSAKTFSNTFVENIRKYYFVEIIPDRNNSTNESSALELRTDTGIMSHWKDYDKLAVYTYLSHLPSATFHTGDEKSTQVPIIPLIGSFRNGRVDSLNCVAAELLFQDPNISLFLMMPDNVEGLRELKEKLFRENFFNILDSLPKKECQVMVPQLSALTNNLDMSTILKELGLDSIFVNRTLDKKHSTNVYVKSVKQNSFFSTSFTALNSIGSLLTNIDKRIPILKNGTRLKRQNENKIIFDQPFLYFLIHRTSGLILLTGHIKNPTQLPV